MGIGGEVGRRRKVGGGGLKGEWESVGAIQKTNNKRGKVQRRIKRRITRGEDRQEV